MFDVIIPAAGESYRMNGENKLLLKIANETVLERSILAFINRNDVAKVIVSSKDVESNKTLLSHLDQSKLLLITGGSTRCISVALALEHVNSEYVLVHDAARPFVSESLINCIIDATKKKGTAVPALKITDSIRKISNESIIDLVDRSELVSVQTPQGFKSSNLKTAFKKRKHDLYTDESAIYTAYFNNTHFVAGDEQNRKITNFSDYLNVNAIVGMGYDIHNLAPNRPLILGGVKIDSEMGTISHSDGDAVIHSIVDAILSALGERDIGCRFPDSDENFKDANSVFFLNSVMDLVKAKTHTVQNLSVVIIVDRPKLNPYILEMKKMLSRILNISTEKIGISAKTSENNSPTTVVAHSIVVLI
ncbi:MAG: 2-C-methyl-D-erythritol 2,4-cyclodiphosphate synthase [Christensenellaceae bacterium]|jgi:2-C-methyl-D-erythritol 4-phosphate cytidylyltransferase/2-C-methyl-D-erythritol 2,4-cyclodiphosphate synthase|nr:2-C-methyl-D-erythritol 2,4-cyclodiphosphate synthase [Christensenellaceae bacterium]